MFPLWHIIYLITGLLVIWALVYGVYSLFAKSIVQGLIWMILVVPGISLIGQFIAAMVAFRGIRTGEKGKKQVEERLQMKGKQGNH